MIYFGFDRPSFGFKTIGFPANVNTPKLSADFMTGTYKANGATKTFADLFTFSRAGKAWLVKESGLVEYAIDVPRFDDGLLLEQSATNVYPDSAYKLNNLPNRVDENVIFKTGGGVQLNPTGRAGSFYYLGLTPERYSVSIYVKSVIKPKVGTDASDNFWVRYDSSSLEGVVVNEHRSDIYKLKGSLIPTTASPRHTGILRQTSQTDNVSLLFYIFQVEPGLVVSSPIVTTKSPVTRPADFLASKITGTTLTGDWDATLNLSLVNGQITHTGYGCIRTLEIN